jgi:isocitrate/isopropylmalate dehydrogenase
VDSSDNVQEASRLEFARRSHEIVSVLADGIGPESVSAAIEVVKTLAYAMGTFTINFIHIPWETASYDIRSDMLKKLT